MAVVSGAIRAVFFDAVGTVLHPVRGAPTIYAETAAHFGLPAEPALILQRFRDAYRREEATDAANGWVTSEAREQERWRAIVRETLPDAPDGCFEMLYHHFAQPEAWEVPASFADVLEALHQRGFALGLASNYDSRLEQVLAGRPELARLQPHILISSQIGYRKPDRRFFARILEAANCPAHQILYVGDDLHNDYQGASDSGLSPLLLDPNDQHPAVPSRIRSLSELFSDTLFG